MGDGDVVNYKVFLCAAGFEPEIRRITIDKDISRNYFFLKQKLISIFPTLKDTQFTISWKDVEGDTVRICSDDELVIALKEMENQPFKKVYVATTPQQGNEGPVHPNVVCDGCEQPIQGFRYKCIECPNFDLCADCERSQLHPDHAVIRIPLPMSLDGPFCQRFFHKIARHVEHLSHASEKWERKAGREGRESSRRERRSGGRCPAARAAAAGDPLNQLFNFLGSHWGQCPREERPQPPNAGEGDQANSSQDVGGADDYSPLYEQLRRDFNGFVDRIGPLSASGREDAGSKASGSSAAQPQEEQGEAVPVQSEAAPREPTRQPPSSQPRVIPIQLSDTQPQPDQAQWMKEVPYWVKQIQQLHQLTRPAKPEQPQPAQPPTQPQPVQPVNQLQPVQPQPPQTQPAQPQPIPVQFVQAQPQEPQPGTSDTVPPQQVPLASRKAVEDYLNSVTGTASQLISGLMDPRRAEKEDSPVLDSTWTVIPNSPAAPAPEAGVEATPQASSEAPQRPSPPPAKEQQEQLYPAIPVMPITASGQNIVDETLKRLTEMGFVDDEGWLRQLVENKNGSLEEVLHFLTPIPKPSPNNDKK